MKQEFMRRTVALDTEAEKALEKVRKKYAVRKRKANVSEAVRTSLINEAKTK